LVAMDGSSFELPDEPDNEAQFGRPGSRTGVAGYPPARCAVLVECVTQAMQGARREIHPVLRTNLIGIEQAQLAKLSPKKQKAARKVQADAVAPKRAPKRGTQLGPVFGLHKNIFASTGGGVLLISRIQRLPQAPARAVSQSAGQAIKPSRTAPLPARAAAPPPTPGSPCSPRPRPRSTWHGCIQPRAGRPECGAPGQGCR